GPCRQIMNAASAHTVAAIVSSGDELVLGQTLDTNSRWLSEQLTSRGIRVVEHVTLGDDQAAHVAAFRRLASSVDLIVMTGG
ncbi:molybdopterin-binding protein, partial [Klebsiella pneumoniae]|uniref:molybdopterin-binding protein n=1 Tax=Klebsiella pneumoniae TaxID=573 RepID=UPI0022BA0489